MADLDQSVPEPQTWKLTLAYDGTDFSGWQVQPGEATIQGELQAALGESLANHHCRRARDAPTPGFTRWPRWPAFALQAPIPAENLQARPQPDIASFDSHSGVENSTKHLPCAALGRGKDL